MSEFCLACLNKINDTNLAEKDVIISKDIDLCEECGNLTKVVVKFKKRTSIAMRFRKDAFRSPT